MGNLDIIVQKKISDYETADRAGFHTKEVNIF